MHLLQVHYRFFIRGARVTRITGRSRPPGGVGLTPRQYTAWNVRGCARTTGGLSLSRGCCLQCSVLLALGGVLPNLELELSHKETKQQTDPRSCARVVYIAGDTLCHQPMGMGHMTVLQFRGPITFCVLQWCHPMLTRTLWSPSCSARMIALYGDRKRIQARAPIICGVPITSIHASLFRLAGGLHGCTGTCHPADRFYRRLACLCLRFLIRRCARGTPIPLGQ